MLTQRIGWQTDSIQCYGTAAQIAELLQWFAEDWPKRLDSITQWIPFDLLLPDLRRGLLYVYPAKPDRATIRINAAGGAVDPADRSPQHPYGWIDAITVTKADGAYTQLTCYLPEHPEVPETTKIALRRVWHITIGELHEHGMIMPGPKSTDVSDEWKVRRGAPLLKDREPNPEQLRKAADYLKELSRGKSKPTAAGLAEIKDYKTADAWIKAWPEEVKKEYQQRYGK